MFFFVLISRNLFVRKLRRVYVAISFLDSLMFVLVSDVWKVYTHNTLCPKKHTRSAWKITIKMRLSRCLAVAWRHLL